MEITLSLTADERIPMRRFMNDVGLAAPMPAMRLALRLPDQRRMSRASARAGQGYGDGERGLGEKIETLSGGARGGEVDKWRRRIAR